jgi:hypothetical protein
LGSNLFQQLQPLFAQRRSPIGEPREVTGGAGFVTDKAGTDRIADTYENNRYGADFRLNNRRHQVGVSDQRVRSETHQLREDSAYPAGIRRGKVDIDEDIAPFLPTQLLQFLPQRFDLSLS